MNPRIYLTITIMLWSLLLNAQKNGVEYIIGTNYLITSQFLNESRTIQIHVPPGYSETNSKYPVLYVLDGQRFFSYAISLSQSFSQFKLTPDFIIVGINTEYPKRFQDMGDRKDQFIAFLEKELIPHVESHYRANDERLFFGWEFGGGMVFNTLLKNPSLFSGYLMASPYPIMDRVEELGERPIVDNTLLYFAVSPDEYEINHSINRLEDILSNRKSDSLTWIGQSLEIEEHRSTGYPTLYNGLRNYFKYYPEFECNNLANFQANGGLEYARMHASERARQYGFSGELSLWSRYTIVRSAIRAENVKQMKQLIEELGSANFIRELVVGNLGYAASDIAKSYESNNDYEEAIKVYEVILEEQPTAESILIRISKAHGILGHKKQERKYLELANSIK